MKNKIPSKKQKNINTKDIINNSHHSQDKVITYHSEGVGDDKDNVAKPHSEASFNSCEDDNSFSETIRMYKKWLDTDQSIGFGEYCYNEGMKKAIEILKIKYFCNNCRFSCQASDCECICHDGWIKRDEIKQLLEKEIK